MDTPPLILLLSHPNLPPHNKNISLYESTSLQAVGPLADFEAATYRQLTMTDNCNSVHACAAITEQNQRESRLLRLPGEFRNAIYGYVFDEGTYAFIGMRDGRDVVMALIDAKPHQLAILSVCRQIYHEACMLPFLLNTIRFNTLHTFLQRTNFFTRPQCHAIKRLHVVTRVLNLPHVPRFLAKMRRHNVQFAGVHPNVERVDIDLLLDKRFMKESLMYKVHEYGQQLKEWFQDDSQEGKQVEVVIREILDIYRRDKNFEGNFHM
ncbi:Nn.00g058190.m01.CDS01 [Neocucurbitaria sp. VM-36]